jgi:hypothetical protein
MLPAFAPAVARRLCAPPLRAAVAAASARRVCAPLLRAVCALLLRAVCAHTVTVLIKQGEGLLELRDLLV